MPLGLRQAGHDEGSLGLNTVKKSVFVLLGVVCFALGLIGAFLPVLPTTPFLLAAAFLFSRSSQRLDAWLAGTKLYRSYVEPFRKGQGITLRKKLRILVVSYALMGVSAIVVAQPVVWAVLACVALGLLWAMVVRVPAVKEFETS